MNPMLRQYLNSLIQREDTQEEVVRATVEVWVEGKPEQRRIVAYYKVNGRMTPEPLCHEGEVIQQTVDGKFIATQLSRKVTDE